MERLRNPTLVIAQFLLRRELALNLPPLLHIQMITAPTVYPILKVSFGGFVSCPITIQEINEEFSLVFIQIEVLAAAHTLFIVKV